VGAIRLSRAILVRLGTPHFRSDCTRLHPATSSSDSGPERSAESRRLHEQPALCPQASPVRTSAMPWLRDVDPREQVFRTAGSNRQRGRLSLGCSRAGRASPPRAPDRHRARAPVLRSSQHQRGPAAQPGSTRVCPRRPRFAGASALRVGVWCSSGAAGSRGRVGLSCRECFRVRQSPCASRAHAGHRTGCCASIVVDG